MQAEDFGTDREAGEGLSLCQIKCCIDHGVLQSSARVLGLKSRLRSQQSPDNRQSWDPKPKHPPSSPTDHKDP